MTTDNKNSGKVGDGWKSGEELDPMKAELSVDGDLEQALKNFKSSVHAWSDSAYHRPRGMTRDVKRRSWRLALGWAMGCVLVVGSVSGGLLERQHRQEVARMAAQQQAAERQKLLTEQRAAKESQEDLLAEVDADVSRQVPSALEPMSEIMGDEETK